jgi:hypothetical protein
MCGCSVEVTDEIAVELTHPIVNLATDGRLWLARWWIQDVVVNPTCGDRIAVCRIDTSLKVLDTVEILEVLVVSRHLLESLERDLSIAVQPFEPVFRNHRGVR